MRVEPPVHPQPRLTWFDKLILYHHPWHHWYIFKCKPAQKVGAGLYLCEFLLVPRFRLCSALHRNRCCVEKNTFERKHPSLEVYFWYHQNFYKTFSDNNILKEEPCFCAWTRSPQKCFRSEYRKKEQKSKIRKRKAKKNQQETSDQRKQCSAYLHPTEIEFSLQENGWGGDSRGSPGVAWWTFLKCGNLTQAFKEKRG